MKPQFPPRPIASGLLLFFTALFAFGLFAPRLGFYHDDWVFLEIASRGRGFWGVVQALARTPGLWPRPVEIAQYALFYACGGLHPAPYHFLLVALAAVEGMLLFLLWKRLLGGHELALTAACLTILMPNRSVLHVWFASSPAVVAQVLILASLLCHMDWLAKGGWARLALSLTAYLLSVLCYESTAFMPFMLAAPVFLKARQTRGRLAPALADTAAALGPFVAALGAALFWQWLGSAALTHHANPKSQVLAISLSHIFKAYGAGFECLTNRLLHICWQSLGPAFSYLGLPLILLLCVFAVALAWLLTSEEASSQATRSAPRAMPLALATAAGGFVAAYAPYALSGSYMPQIYGIMSRTNGNGAWVAGLLLALGLAVLRRRPRRVILAAMLAAFTATQWVGDRQWLQAWEKQQDILSKVAPPAVALPPGSTVLLADAPHFVGYAVIFDAPYDFAAALRLATGRRDLDGKTRAADIQPEAPAATPIPGIRARRPAASRNLYIYSYGRNTLEPSGGPAAKPPTPRL